MVLWAANKASALHNELADARVVEHFKGEVETSPRGNDMDVGVYDRLLRVPGAPRCRSEHARRVVVG